MVTVMQMVKSPNKKKIFSIFLGLHSCQLLLKQHEMFHLTVCVLGKIRNHIKMLISE